MELGDRYDTLLVADRPTDAGGPGEPATIPLEVALLPAPLRRELQGGSHRRSRPSRVSAMGVRIFDVTLAGAALLLAAPVMLAVAAVVKVSSAGPVFYGSERQSGGGNPSRVFRAWKFRSMFGDADERLESLLASDRELRATYERYSKLPYDPRVTRVGRWMRLLSIDELPQLWNVLRGDMSLVGPRPKLAHEVPVYGELFAVVCRVKPGLTGLWQVSGRSALSLEQRIVLDVQYALTRTFRLDVLICLKTAGQLLSPDRSQAH